MVSDYVLKSPSTPHALSRLVDFRLAATSQLILKCMLNITFDRTNAFSIWKQQTFQEAFEDGELT